MNTYQQTLDQILQMTRTMLRYGSSAQWELLTDTDAKRAELVTQLQHMETSTGHDLIVQQIRSLQTEVMQLVLEERNRIEHEYAAAKEKLSASSSYLEHMESTLT